MCARFGRDSKLSRKLSPFADFFFTIYFLGFVYIGTHNIPMYVLIFLRRNSVCVCGTRRDVLVLYSYSQTTIRKKSSSTFWYMNKFYFTVGDPKKSDRFYLCKNHVQFFFFFVRVKYKYFYANRIQTFSDGNKGFLKKFYAANFCKRGKQRLFLFSFVTKKRTKTRSSKIRDLSSNRLFFFSVTNETYFFIKKVVIMYMFTNIFSSSIYLLYEKRAIVLTRHVT